MLLGCVAISVAVLGRGADWLVEGASNLAVDLGMPKVIIGATIVSLGTTSPECAVSVMAAWSGEPGLALGNAVGSIIADSGLIFGLGCAWAVLPADRFVLNRQGWVQVGAGVLLALLCYGAYLVSGPEASLGSRTGLLMIVLLGAYLFVSIHWSREHPEGTTFVLDQENGASGVSATTLFLPLVMVSTGLVFVIVASHVLVQSVSEIAVQIGVPKLVIAGTLVAFGTSLPELVVGMTSIRKGHPELLVGTVIGADILNVLFVIGASALAAPLPIFEPQASVPHVFLLIHLPAMLTVLLIFRLSIVAAVRKGHFDRWMALPLLATYIGYVVIQFVITTR